MSHTSLGPQYFDINLFCFANSYPPFHHFPTICLLSDSPRFINADTVWWYFFAASVRFPDTGVLLPSGVSGTLQTHAHTLHRVTSQSAVCFLPLLPQHNDRGLGLLFTNQHSIFFFSCTWSLVRFSLFFEAQTNFFWSLGKSLEWGSHIDTSCLRNVKYMFSVKLFYSPVIISRITTVLFFREKWTVEDYMRWLLSFCINVFILQTENRTITLNNRLSLQSFISQLFRFNQPCNCRKTSS